MSFKEAHFGSDGKLMPEKWNLEDCVCARMWECVCVCVCVRERQRERFGGVAHWKAYFQRNSIKTQDQQLN